MDWFNTRDHSAFRMSRTIKMKPNKISAMLKAFDNNLDLVQDIVLDLWKGFSTRIYLQIGSDEEEDANYYLPVFVSSDIDDWGDMIDVGRALQMGLLEVADNDTAVTVKPVDEELETLCANRQESDPGGGQTHPLKRINARLLNRLRRYLLPGKQYKLRFCGARFTIWSKFGNRESTCQATLTPSEWPEDARVQMICGPEPLLFTVVAGVPIPRFTVSFSISSSRCYLGDPCNFFVTLTVTSLEDRPVTVDLLLDRTETDLYPSEPYSRWNEKLSADVFNINDEETGKWGTLHSKVGRLDKNPMEKAAVRLLQFNKGTTHTRKVYFSRDELSSHECLWRDDFAGLTPKKTYKMAIRTMGYVAWDYGHAHELREAHRDQQDWNKHGPIIFEPVSAVALIIKTIIEREKPQPFFSLPQELRDQVYEYVRQSERADEVRFTAKEGREPHTNGFDGAMRSG